MSVIERRRELLSGGEVLMPVGGRIFYIDSSATGATYKFYTSDETEITDITVAGLANAFYYTKTGNSDKDKFYVYDTMTRTDPYSKLSVTNGLLYSSDVGICWGYWDTNLGITTDGIGQGKKNTNAVLNIGVPTDHMPNIWGYVKRMRDDLYFGCYEWFIASKAEQDLLRSSGLVDWYSSHFIMSSVEYDDHNAYYWNSSNSRWDTYYGKILAESCAFAARAF